MLSKYYLILVKSYDELDEWRPFLVTSSVSGFSFVFHEFLTHRPASCDYLVFRGLDDVYFAYNNMLSRSKYSKSYIKRLARANLLDITSMLGIIDGSAYDSFYRYFCSVSERAF